MYLRYFEPKKIFLGIWGMATFFMVAAFLCCGVLHAQSWVQIPSSPYHPVRHNDLFQQDNILWVVNGSGKIFKSTDLGHKWTLVHHNPKAHFRSIVFLDSLTGFCANLGPGVYPLTEDTVALYKTIDGGENWSPVSIRGNQPAGICNLKILPAEKKIFGVGRIGGPSGFVVSNDWGNTWESVALPKDMKLAVDVHFWDGKNGIVVGGNDSLLAKSRPIIYKTSDQGKTWSQVFISPYVGGVCWKIQILNDGHGFISVMDHANNGYFLYTKNIFMARPFEIRELGVGVFAGKGIFFRDEKNGWIGGDDKQLPLKTKDAGMTWAPDTSLGLNVNKFIKTDKKTIYSVGNYVYKLI